MGLYRPSALVEQMSGKVGGVVFNQNYTVRTNRYASSRTENQIPLRSAFGAISSSWRSLVVAEYLGWIDYAPSVELTNRLGRTYHPSGLNCYVAVNTLRLQASLDVQSTPPESLGMSQAYFSNVDFQAGAVADVSSNNLILTSATLFGGIMEAPPEGDVINVYLADSIPTSRPSLPKSYLYVGTIMTEDPMDATYTFTVPSGVILRADASGAWFTPIRLKYLAAGIGEISPYPRTFEGTCVCNA